MAIKRNLFRDILRDTNSIKYSMTKVAAFTTLLLLVAAACSAIAIMVIHKDVDHVLIAELIALLLTLLGYKNFKTSFPVPPAASAPKGDIAIDDNLDDA